MIASGAVPAPLPAHTGVSQTSQITITKDFADTLRRGPIPSAGEVGPGPCHTAEISLNCARIHD